jgi:uncharacterized coiled-coil protein SlyX
MAGNRVEELEAKVRELEATIDGLTDELVETKERLQAVEDEAGVQDDVLDRRSTPARQRQVENGAAEEAPADDGAAEEEPADGDAEPSADDVNAEGTEGEDDADSDSSDDIIVA